MPLPAAVLVGLPVGGLGTASFGLIPAQASYFNGFRIVAVEQQYDALIISGIRYQIRAIDEEAYRRTIRIFGTGGQHDRLLRGFGISGGGVRQECVVTPGPQMRIERLHTLFGGRLNDHAPAALERFLQQRR